MKISLTRHLVSLPRLIDSDEIEALRVEPSIDIAGLHFFDRCFSGLEELGLGCIRKTALSVFISLLEQHAQKSEVSSMCCMRRFMIPEIDVVKKAFCAVLG